MLRVKRIIIILVVLLLCLLGFIGYKKFYNTKKKEVIKKEEKITKKEDNYSSPEIRLLGREEDTRIKNGVYEEYGATASDEYDGDLTSKIETINEIDITKAGTYYVTYKVTNSKNKTSEIKRKVNVIEADDIDTDGISVLMYHYFYDDTIGEVGEDSNYLEKSLFEEQLKYLTENNYYFPNMKEIRKYVDGNLDLPSKSVVLTLDDGHADNYTIAYPLAVKYKVPIVMFIVTSWTNPKDELQQAMIDTGYVYMMSHTHDMHQAGCSGIQHGSRILCIDYETGVNDLKTSIDILGNNDALAYPTGDNNDNSRRIVEDAGFNLAFTVDFGRVTKYADPLTLPRVRVSQGNSLSYFISTL